MKATPLIKILTALTMTAFVTLGICKICFANCPSDTTQSPAAKKKWNIKFTTRLHSLGMFGYGGRIASMNPAMDFHVNYDRRAWGLLVFKGMDIYDIHSSYNFTMTMVYTNININSRLRITPYCGVVLDQEKTLADFGSDGMVILVSSFKLNKNFTFEYGARFSNVLLEQTMFDWLNRVRLLYTKDHLDMVLSCWHNNNVFDYDAYTTVGMQVSYGRIKVIEHVMMGMGITGLVMPYSSDESEFPKRNGLMLTIAAIVD